MQEREKRKRDNEGADALLQLSKMQVICQDEIQEKITPVEDTHHNIAVQTDLTMDHILHLEKDAVNCTDKICDLKDTVSKLSFSESDLEKDPQRAKF